MTPDRKAQDKTIISKVQIYADIVYGIFCLPTLHFYRLYFVFVYISVAVIIDFILLKFIAEGNMGGILDMGYTLENLRVFMILVPLLEFTY